MGDLPPATEPAFRVTEHVGAIKTAENLRTWLLGAEADQDSADRLPELVAGWSEGG